jgi:hypothetical protein
MGIMESNRNFFANVPINKHDRGEKKEAKVPMDQKKGSES